MTPLRLLWRVLSGEDAKETLRNSAILEAHERRIAALERKEEAKEVIRRIVGEDR